MYITVNIPDEQWEEFQQVAQEAVEQSWNGKYEDFATYIMTVNNKTYIESQKRKQEKMMKRALASYEEIMEKETPVLTESPDSAPSLKDSKKPEEKPKDVPMTNKEISARIMQLQAIAVKQRTLAQTEELNDLLKRSKNEAKK